MATRRTLIIECHRELDTGFESRRSVDRHLFVIVTETNGCLRQACLKISTCVVSSEIYPQLLFSPTFSLM